MGCTAAVRAQLQHDLDEPDEPSFPSLLMPVYGVEQDPRAATAKPSLRELFSEEEVAAMAEDPELLEFARSELRSYRADYYWNGYVRDSRLAYVGMGHDFEGTRRTFRQFREVERRIREKAQREHHETIAVDANGSSQGTEG